MTAFREALDRHVDAIQRRDIVVQDQHAPIRD